MAPFRIMNSLQNGLKGGVPVTARKPARKSGPETGRRRDAPRTSSMRFDPYARWMLPAARKRTP
jgi:hypothetical protein